jgi:hypothetical protein
MPIEDPQCYFEGDTMQPISLVGDCDLGDPADTKLWFRNFLTACIGPMTRILAHSKAKRLHLSSQGGEDTTYISISLETGEKTTLTCVVLVDGRKERSTLSRSLRARSSGDTWHGDPTLHMILTMQQILREPLSIMFEISALSFRSTEHLPTEVLVSQWRRGIGTLQLLVPRYVEKLD